MLGRIEDDPARSIIRINFLVSIFILLSVKHSPAARFFMETPSRIGAIFLILYSFVRVYRLLHEVESFLHETVVAA